MVERIIYNEKTNIDVGSTFFVWYVIIQTLLVISKYSITKEMPWTLVLLPTIIVGVLLLIGIIGTYFMFRKVKRKKWKF